MMVNDAKNFVFVPPVKLPAGITAENLESFLADNPYVVMSHSQLVRFADGLKSLVNKPS